MPDLFPVQREDLTTRHRDRHALARPAAEEGTFPRRPRAGMAQAALFSDAASATAIPLSTPRPRPPLETLTWQEPPAATEEDAS